LRRREEYILEGILTLYRERRACFCFQPRKRGVNSYLASTEKEGGREERKGRIKIMAGVRSILLMGKRAADSLAVKKNTINFVLVERVTEEDVKSVLPKKGENRLLAGKRSGGANRRK